MTWSVEKLKEFLGADQLTEAQLEDLARVLNGMPDAVKELPEVVQVVI